MQSTMTKALRIAAAWAVLAAILACGGNEDDTPPPPPPVPVAPPAPPPPVAPPPQPVMQETTVVQLATGFLPDPHTARGQAGGMTPVRVLAPESTDCRGHFPAAPQHSMILQTDFRNLRVMSHSAQDTTLAIRGPDGRHYCSDDDEGINPIVSRAFTAGTYQIYVGTYHPGRPAPYVLGISELRDVTPATLGY